MRSKEKERAGISRIFSVTVLIVAIVVASVAAVETLRLRPSHPTTTSTTNNGTITAHTTTAGGSSKSTASNSSTGGYAIVFTCSSGCTQSLPNGNNVTGLNNNWTMAWVVMFPKYNAGFAYDADANVPSGWNYPYPYYANEPLGVYSSQPNVSVNNTYFYPALWFQQGKYGYGSPGQNLTLKVSVYAAAKNSSANFWAFGYNQKMISQTQDEKALDTSYIIITPNADSRTNCTFNVPSTGNAATCGSSDPSIHYIPTNNSPDIWTTAIYSAVNTNTGTQGWVFETGQNDSLLLVSDNQIVATLDSFADETPTGIAFDSRNNLAYITNGIPGDCIACPYGVYEVSGNSVSYASNLNVTGWPAAIAYDPQYDYLYFSYVLNGIHFEEGIGVVNPNSGAQLAYFFTGFDSQAALFAYDSNNGDMFALVPRGGGATLFDISGISIASSYNAPTSTISMTFDSNDNELYLGQGNGSIIIVNASNGSQVGKINSYVSSPNLSVVMVFDTKNGYLYAFEGPEELVISGTSVVVARPVGYDVASAFYDPVFNNILAFY